MSDAPERIFLNRPVRKQNGANIRVIRTREAPEIDAPPILDNRPVDDEASTQYKKSHHDDVSRRLHRLHRDLPILSAKPGRNISERVVMRDGNRSSTVAMSHASVPSVCRRKPGARESIARA